MVGEHTALVDDPQLTVREVPIDWPPIRVVLLHDAAELPADAKLFEQQTPVWLLAATDSRHQWPDLFKCLWANGHQRPSWLCCNNRVFSRY